MNETWRDIPTALGYQASDLGLIRNARSKTVKLPSLNNQGFVKVTLFIESKHVTRGVAGLVADAFLGIDYDPRFNSIIHRNAERTDCRPVNLLRRPRDFAIEYHTQFDPFRLARFGPMNIRYREVMTQEVFENITVPAQRFGLLCRKIYFSACNRGGEPVWPTEQRFVFDHWT